MSSKARIIRDGVVMDDEWTLVTALDAGTRAVDKSILPMSNFLALSAAEQPRYGVWLDSHHDPAALADVLPRLALIAINFPKFTDGRGYSIASTLRSRFGYRGELRAIGDVLQDQLFYLQRVGFNAFALRADKDIDSAVKSLGDFSETYQGAVDQPLPLFRRRSGRLSTAAHELHY